MKRLALALLLLLCLSGNAWHVHTLKINEVVGSVDSFPWQRIDLLPVVVGTRIALKRQNPYSAAALKTIDLRYFGYALSPQELAHRNLMGFAYPLPIVFVFAPLAALPFKVASGLYLILSILTLTLLPLLWLRVLGIQLSRSGTALLLLASLACWPVVWELRVENIVVTIAACLAVGLLTLQRGHPATAGVLIALGALKPQVSLLLILWLVAWAIAQRQRRFLVGFATTSLLLLAGSFALRPDWIGDWRAGLITYEHYTRVFSLLPLPVAVAVALIVSIPLYRALQSSCDSRPFGVAVSLSLAAMLTLEKFNWPHAYDYLVLFPACLIIALRKPEAGAFLRGCSLLLLTLEFLLGPLSSLLELAKGDSPILNALPGFNVLLPLSLTVTLVFSYSVRRNRSKTATIDESAVSPPEMMPT